MGLITYECIVSEFETNPDIESDVNKFTLRERCMEINILDRDGDVIFISELEKENALELAKLIILKYS